MTKALRIGFAAAVLCALSAGCSPAIGDDCSSSVDCSVDGDRVCDQSQPGGYCTVQGCDLGTCPEESVCVEWQGDLDRTAETWCMLKCSSSSDCRTGEGYDCVDTSDPRLLSSDGLALASVFEVDAASQRFCAAVQ